MRAGSILGLLGSLGVHAAVVAIVLLTQREAPAQPSTDAVFPIELTDLGPVPPLGALDGVAGSTAPADASPPPKPDQAAPPTPHAQPTPHPEATHAAATPTTAPATAPTTATTAPTTPSTSSTDAEHDAMREAVRKAMLAPDYVPTTAGSGTAAAPLGSPTGTPNGGGGKPGMSAKYKGLLDGWFSSRVALGGLDIPWEELKTLRVTVSISLTPDRQVAGFSIVSSSGNAAYDARVRSSLQSTVGGTLPAPTDGSEVPSHLTLGFQCRTQERCS